MALSHGARQALTALWERIEQPSTSNNGAAGAWNGHAGALDELEREGLIERDVCDVALTDRGWLEAARIVHCRPLADFAPGEEGHIACVQSHDQRAFHKLMAMGVLPGNPIRLLRRSPAFVFQVGYSQFAVDRDIAAKIFARPAA